MKDLNSVIIEGALESVDKSGKKITLRSESNRPNTFRAAADGKIADCILSRGAFSTKIRIAGQLDSDGNGMLIKIEHIEFM
jgi:hypothetical protein